jgi:hypothetical protein
MLIQGVLWMLRQAISRGTPNAISLQASASGVMRYVNQDGRIVDLFGQVVAHANPSASQATAKEQTTSAICGQSGLNSLSSADLTLSLGNKLKARLNTDGSILFKMTWKEKVTALGLPVSLLRASVRRISDTDCTSWRSPQRSDGEGGGDGNTTRDSGQIQVEGRSSSGELANDIDARPQGWVRGGPDEGRQDQHGHTGRNGTTGFWATADWIDCKDGKTRPVEPSTFPLAYGAPARVGRLRAYGNAIVPQAAQAFIEAYLET